MERIKELKYNFISYKQRIRVLEKLIGKILLRKHMESKPQLLTALLVSQFKF